MPISFVNDTLDKEILEALQAQLSTNLPWAKKVEVDKVIVAYDQAEYDTPYIQAFDNGQKLRHERARLVVKWSVIVELCIKENINSTFNQGDLLTYRQQIEQAIGSDVTLGGKVINVLYLGNHSDIGLLRPNLISQQVFEIEYHKPYTGVC